MKKIIASFVLGLLLAPAVTSAALVSWDRYAAGEIRPQFLNDVVNAIRFNATSTTQASVFPLASSTALTATTLYTNSFRLPLLSDGCAEIASGVLTSTGIACGSGSGGGLATTTPWTAGQLAVVATDGAVKSIATSTLSETVTGLEFDANPWIVGTARTLSLTSGYTIPLTASTTEWATAYASTTALTPSYIRGLFSNSATGLTYNSSTGATSLTAGYVIPLSASTTEWTNFYNTPSTRITAGTGLSWAGNTLNATNNGTVTSVDMSLPTGFTLSGNPITSSGTFSVGYLSGYSLLSTTTLGSLINDATAKTTPADNDMFGLMDSADSNILKKLSFANLQSAVLEPSSVSSTTLNAGGYTNDYVLTASSTAPGGLTWEGASAAGADVQTFTASGTWTKPSGKQYVDFVIIGGGGGGGGGSATAFEDAGGGGAPGALIWAQGIPIDFFGSTESVTVGAGGTGGSANSASDNSTNGGSSSIAAFSRVASGGNRGAKATTSPGAGGAATTTWQYKFGIDGYLTVSTSTGSAGGAGGAYAGGAGTAGSNLAKETPGPTGGGGGGATSFGGNSGGGGNGGALTSSSLFTSLTQTSGGAGGGTVSGTDNCNAGSAGNSYTSTTGTYGTGGGGGSGGRNNLCNGAAGGNYGAGGGGGGGGGDAANENGGGGAGAGGLVVMISY